MLFDILFVFELVGLFEDKLMLSLFVMVGIGFGFGWGGLMYFFGVVKLILRLVLIIEILGFFGMMDMMRNLNVSELYVILMMLLGERVE